MPESTGSVQGSGGEREAEGGDGAAGDEWAVSARIGLEKQLRRYRRQSRAAWFGHVKFGFYDALVFMGVWWMVNVTLLIGFEPSAAPVLASDVNLVVVIVWSLFAAAWVIGVAARWWMARARIIRAHRQTLADFDRTVHESDE